MSWQQWGIAVTGGLVGAGVTQVIIGLRERRSVERVRIYSALRIALSFEAFAESCAHTVDDYGTYIASRGSAGSPLGKLPDVPTFPADVDFRHLPPLLVEQALRFSGVVERGDRHIGSLFEHAMPDDCPLDELMRVVATAGIGALDVAKAFRHAGGLPARVAIPDAWSYEDYLLEKRGDGLTVGGFSFL